MGILQRPYQIRRPRKGSLQNQLRAFRTLCHVLRTNELPEHVPNHDGYHLPRSHSNGGSSNLHGRHPHRYPYRPPSPPKNSTPNTGQTRGTRPIPQTRKVYFRSTRGRIRMDRVKVQGVDGWQRPKNLTELRGWMGFINFYRRFIEGFSNIARVLNELTKKGVPWEWTDEREEAFQKLKRLICAEPVLLMPKLEEPFELEVDA